MLKSQKKKSIRKGEDIQDDNKFERIMYFSGWIFLLAMILFLGFWFIFDLVLSIVNIQLGAESFSYIIFTGTNCGLSFGLASIIKNNAEKKKSLFLDWLVSEFLLCMFAIFAVAAYQW